MRRALALLPLAVLLACGDKADDTAAADSGHDHGDHGTDADTDGGTDEDTDGGDTEPVITDIDSDALAALLDAEAAGGEAVLLINTHVPDEGEIPGTDVHIAYTDGAELVAGVGEDLDRLVVVYCKTGPMSLTAAETLIEAGYTRVHDLPEGMVGWQASGRDLD